MAIQPGHYPKLSNDEYHADSAISKSKLDVVDETPAKFHSTFITKETPREVTPAMRIGSALHSATLTPDLFPHEYARGPKVDRRYTEGKKIWAEFLADNIGKTVLDDDEWEMIIGMRDAVRRHEQAWPYIAGPYYEEAFFAHDPETGMVIKCKPDSMTADFIVGDLKSTDDAGEDGFGRSAANFRYDVQGGWYPYVLANCPQRISVKNFVFVAVERQKPHVVGVYYMTVDQFTPALDVARRNLETIKTCMETGVWPDHARQHGPQPLKLPRYYTMRRGAPN